MVKESDIIQSARSALNNCLEKIPFLQVQYLQPMDLVAGGADMVALIHTQAGEWRMVIEVKSSSQPRHARLAVYQLRDILQGEDNAYGMLIAPYISPEAGRICEESGIGYLDLAGNCLISFDTIYIRQGGAPNPNPQKRSLRSLYSPRGERILRILLDQPGRVWKLVDLAKTAGVSLGQVANIKQLLLDREWLHTSAEGIALSSPSALLDEWGKAYKFERNKTIDCYALAEISEIEGQIAETCKQRGDRYAFTGFSSAARIAPMVRYQKVSAYVEGDLSRLIDTLSWKPVSSGANVSLLIPYDEGVFYNLQVINEIRVVSPLQTYLDLHNFHARGQEAAQAVRRAMEKTW